MPEKKLKILLIDDDPTICEFVKRGLERHNYKVLTAKGGNIGMWLAACHWHKPDLILLDLMMPAIDGFEVLRKLRDDKKTTYTPVIVVTGRTDSASQIKAEGLYCDDYIIKPVELDTLRARIEKVFAKRGIT